MDTINKTLITGLLTMVFIWGSGATEAYTPDDTNKTLVQHSGSSFIIACEDYK